MLFKKMDGVVVSDPQRFTRINEAKYWAQFGHSRKLYTIEEEVGKINGPIAKYPESSTSLMRRIIDFRAPRGCSRNMHTVKYDIRKLHGSLD